jgi:hypothetical protein
MNIENIPVEKSIASLERNLKLAIPPIATAALLRSEVHLYEQTGKLSGKLRSNYTPFFGCFWQ